MAKRLRLQVPDPVGWFFRTGLTKGPPSSNTKIMKELRILSSNMGIPPWKNQEFVKKNQFQD